MWEERLHERAASVIDHGPILDEGRETIETSALDGEAVGPLHMPSDSYAPLLLALSLALVFATLLVHAWAGLAIGLLCVFGVLVGWIWPNRAALTLRSGVLR
jgi:hypothetical protein